MTATDPTANPTNQPPAQPTVPPASPQAETDTAGGTGGCAAPRRLTRSRDDRLLTGVCGGLARHLGLDPTLVRVLVALATVMGAGVVAVGYVVAAVVMPREDPTPVETKTGSVTESVTAPR